MGGFLSHLVPDKNSEVINASCGPILGNIYKHVSALYRTIYGFLGFRARKLSMATWESLLPKRQWEI